MWGDMGSVKAERIDSVRCDEYDAEGNSALQGKGVVTRTRWPCLGPLREVV